MARIMAIDYGSKRVGIAVTDSLQIIATGLTTVHSKDLIAYLDDYFKKEKVECIVVGEPKTLSNEASDSARFIEPFVTHLTRKYPTIKIARYDERFTSALAHQTIQLSGVNKKARANKESVDMISATIILQDFMSANSIK